MKFPFISMHLMSNHNSEQKEWIIGMGAGMKEYKSFKDWLMTPPVWVWKGENDHIRG